MVSTDDIVSQYTHYNRFIKDLKSFHRLNDEYFRADTELKYDGDVICIEYTGINGNAKIVRKKSFAEKGITVNCVTFQLKGILYRLFKT